MVDVYDVRRRCAQAASVAADPPVSTMPRRPYSHARQYSSASTHGRQYSASNYSISSNYTTAPETQNSNINTSTPLRADNTFLKMTNATSSYPLYIKNVPYATASRLQTLDICLPRPLSESPSDAVWVM